MRLQSIFLAFALTVISAVAFAGDCPDPGGGGTTPPVTGACVAGTGSDLPNYKAVCSGTFILHAGACNPLVTGGCPSVFGSFTFDKVFGSNWPGTHFGNDEIFSLGLNQYLTIPFVPSPGHSVSFFVNGTYMPGNNAVFSISTAPGLFNGGRANGTTVLCAQGHNPNLVTTSNGGAAQCKLDPNKTYWFNLAPGVVFNGAFMPCTKAPCKLAVQSQLQN
jgi:hypothetical protein